MALNLSAFGSLKDRPGEKLSARQIARWVITASPGISGQEIQLGARTSSHRHRNSFL